MMRVVFCFCFLLPVLAFSQNLDKIGQKGMMKVSGGLNFSSNMNQAYGKTLARDPFSWVVGGNVTFSVLDFSMPFTFSYTNQGGNFTQPFNITALHPTYKKIKGHVGVISMSFSPYTLAGLNFAGAGLEYTPGKWKIQGFGGRLKKQVAFIPEINNIETMAYRRWGGGISVGYEDKGYGATFILLKASDQRTSLATIPNNATITPMDNIVASLALKGKIGKSIMMTAEYASSILTRNTELTEKIERKTYAKTMSPLVNGNQSTIAFGAFNGSINYQYKIFSIGAKYERIDPGYTTLGGMYFNNDLENITLTPAIALFKGKLNININTGVQRNNLNNLSANEMKRWVGTIAVSSMPFKNFTVSGNYSNFSSFSKRNPASDPFYNPVGDTLNFYQISTNASGSMSYNFGKKRKSTLMLNGNYSVSENITGRLEDAAAFGFNVSGTNQTGPVNVLTGMFGHTLSFEKSKSSLGWTINGSQSRAMGNETLYFGPGVNYSKPVLKWINLTTGLTYNQNYTNSKLANHVMNTRVGLSFKPTWWDKKFGSLNFSLNGSLVNRFAVAKTSKNQGDIALIFNLNYGF